jgi:asparagine synthase (glutamine-hydrolysing)
MEHVMPELIWHLEDLRVGQCYPNYYVARLAGRFMKVVLSGVGGDELFAGYPWRYFRGRSDNGRHAFYHHYYDFWQRLVRDDEKARLFTPDCWARMDQSAVEPLFRQTLDGGGVPFRLDSTEACVNASLYFELKTFLHGLLVVEDKISMAHSLETRVPFLDNDLVDFALRLPVAYKLRHLDRPARWVDENEAGKQRRYELQSGDGKLILREAMARIIPQALAERVKQGFSAPDASWFRGESIDYISSLLLDRHARLYDFVAPAFITETLEEHMSGRSNRRLLIWSLLSFEWWLRKFFG